MQPNSSSPIRPALLLSLVAFLSVADLQQSAAALPATGVVRSRAHPLFVLLPEMRHAPDTYLLPQPAPGMSLYNLQGVCVWQEAATATLAPETGHQASFLARVPDLPAGVYFFATGDDRGSAAAQAQDLRFRDVSATHLPGDSSLAGYAEFADVTGEGDADIVIGFWDQQPPRLLINDGFGYFGDQSQQRLPAEPLAVRDVLVFDVELDGDLDLFLVAQAYSLQFESADMLYLNDGTGHFLASAPTALPRLPAVTQNADWGLINDDAYPDLLLSSLMTEGRLGETSLFVLLNDGAGTFSDHSSTLLPITKYGALDAVLVDVNRDARLDIAMANIELAVTSPTAPDSILALYDGQDAVLVQQPNGVFVDETATRMPPDDSDGKRIMVVDIDNDGAQDLYVINLPFWSAAPQALYRNDGQGVFQDVTASRLPPQPISWLNDAEFRDFDGNGFADLYLVNVTLGGTAPDFFSLNQNGVFSDASDLLPDRVDFGTSCTSGDMDGDGDADLFVSNGGAAEGEKGADLLLENLLLGTGLRPEGPGAPATFALLQNHPNPFSGAPTSARQGQAGTTLNFVLPRATTMTLTIYDTAGRQVAMLVSGLLAAGTHRVHWQPRDLPAGVYLARLHAGERVLTRKLLVLR